MMSRTALPAIALLSTLLAACAVPAAQGPRLTLSHERLPQPAAAGLRVQVLAPAGFGTRALNQPAWIHRHDDVRSLRFELFDCSSLAAAQSLDPGVQAACTSVLTLDKNYPEGFLATSTSFDAGNLKQGRFYTVRARAYTAADAGGSLMGTAWPDQPVSLNREVVGVAADGSLSLSNAEAGASALSLTLQLGSSPVPGGSLSGNRLVVS